MLYPSGYIHYITKYLHSYIAEELQALLPGKGTNAPFHSEVVAHLSLLHQTSWLRHQIGACVCITRAISSQIFVS